MESGPENSLPSQELSPVVFANGRPRHAPARKDDQCHQLSSPGSGAVTAVGSDAISSPGHMLALERLSSDPVSKADAKICGKEEQKRPKKRSKRSPKQLMTRQDRMELKRFYKVQLPDVEIRKSVVMDNWKKRMLARRKQMLMPADPVVGHSSDPYSKDSGLAQENALAEEILSSEAKQNVISNLEQDQNDVCDSSSSLSEKEQEKVSRFKIPDELHTTSARSSATAVPPTLALGSNPSVGRKDDDVHKSPRKQNSETLNNLLCNEPILSEKGNQVSHSDETRTRNPEPRMPDDLKAAPIDNRSENKENIPPKNQVPVKKVLEIINPVAELERGIFESRRNPGREISVRVGTNRTFALNGQLFSRVIGPDGTEFLKNAVFVIKSSPFRY